MHILGDLNCDLINPVPDSATKKIKLLYELYQFTQLIDKATRVTITTSSLIDHMVTNTPEKISCVGVIHTGISDHSLIFAIRKTHMIAKQGANTIEIRNMKNFNEQNFLRDLSNQCWEYVYFYADNTNDMWEIWKQLFLEVLNKHAPLQTKRIRSKNTPWVTNEIKNLINTRDSLKRKAVITKLETDWQNYKMTRNKVNIELRKTKRDYFSNKIAGQKCNPREAWKTINSLMGRQNKPAIINELRIGESKLTNSRDIAEGFNEFFSNIGPDLASKIDTTNHNFLDYMPNAKSEFTTYHS